MTDSRFQLLNTINSPSDLRKLPSDKLEQVSKELREYLINILSETPGHFGASLGVVELTVALHYIYNTPLDTLIWDVGHQAYGHKVLTGRRDRFNTLRQYKGVSGFPSPAESNYDAFGVGHSSTSISAALGIAAAKQLKGDKSHVVAVIGDGALTGGMAFEALNNASENNSNVLIILNDNNISIDPNVGGISRYLTKISASEMYNKLRDRIWNFLGLFKWIGRKLRTGIQKIGFSTKSFFIKESNLFEAFNIRYFGPVDGHDIDLLLYLLPKLNKIQGPKILHIKTKKGKGYHPAEKNQTLFHAPGKFDVLTGKQRVSGNGDDPPLFQVVFGKSLLELAKKNDKIVGITPAMLSGCSLNIMQKEMPERVFDVGIAEQHAMTFAAGLAAAGMVPFCNIYSSFSQRAYDQIIHDVAIQKLPVIICLDRGGLVGADGATHHGAFDMAFLSCVPNLTIASPLNEQELRNMMFTAQSEPKGPFVIRYPRGRGVMKNWETPFEKIDIGKGQKLIHGEKLAVLTIGPIGNVAARAIKNFDKNTIALFDMRFIKPIDQELLHNVFKTYSNIITIEDGSIKGGLASAVIEFMNSNNYTAHIHPLGIPDYFVEHGAPEDLFRECGIDAQGIEKTIQQIL